MLNMKYIKLLLLPLLAGCALAQTTPINNPYLTGTVTFSTTPSVTGNMTYIDGSNHLQPLTLGTGLTLSGGVLTANTGNGGGGNVFSTIQVGTDAATNAVPINFSPTVTPISNVGKGLRLSPVINNTAAGDSLYTIAVGGNIQSSAAYSGVNYIHLDLGTPTVSGALTLNSYTDLYISQAPYAPTRYGIYQQGANDNNYFAAPSTFNSSLQVNGSTTLSGSTATMPNSIVFTSSAQNFPDGSSFATGVSPLFTFNSRAIFQASSGYVSSFSGSTYFNGYQYYNPSLFTSSSGGILSVNGATGKVGAATLNGLTWDGISTLGLGYASTTQVGGVKVDGSTITINGSGVISASGGGSSGVSSVSGTVSQVLANGTYGSAQTGAVTLTTPQNIDTGANVQFNTLSIGVSYASNIGVDLQPTVVSGGSGGGGAKGVRASASILANGNNDTIYSEAAGGNIAVGSFTGINYYEKFIGAPTFQTGSGNVTNATQLFLAGFGTPGVTIANKYGIYQAGTETNVFKGIVVLPHSTVSGLPSASTVQYGEAFVSDATQSPGSSIGSVVTGGGSYIRKVYSDGTNWLLE